jgi:signal transduction histidine kinase
VAGELIDRVSSISLDLRPPMLDDLGLLPALLWFMDRYTSRTGIHVDFLHTNLQDQRFASVVETAVYRLAQEALTNVARHANVSKAKVRVDAGSSSIAISIEDEGQGFDVQAAFDRNDRGGVSGIRERVRLLDGELDIHSVPGQGTNISIHLPLKQKG